MRAERFYADSKTIAVEDIPVPEPGPGEVLSRSRSAGSVTPTSAWSMASSPRS